MILSTLNPRGAEGPPRTANISLISAVAEGARFAAGHGLIRAAMTLTGVFALIVRGMLELAPRHRRRRVRSAAPLGWVR